MFRLLIDTCVWLDLAKDHRQIALLDVLEALVAEGKVSILLPRTVVSEFSRNKTRIAEESSQSLASALKRAKEVVTTLGEGRGKGLALAQLDEVGYRLPRLGESAIRSIGRIEQLFSESRIIDVSETILARAAQRGIEHKAPFHRQRNGIEDAVLIEMYSDFVNGEAGRGVRFAFVTHNTKDFSHPSEDNRRPHPDVACYFSRVKSLYFTSLAGALKRIEPELVTDAMFEHEGAPEPRRLTEILSAEEELELKIWYNRHQIIREMVDSGAIQLVDHDTSPIVDGARRPIRRDIWQGAVQAAKNVEKTYGIKNLGPWSDFEWGMLWEALSTQMGLGCRLGLSRHLTGDARGA